MAGLLNGVPSLDPVFENSTYEVYLMAKLRGR